MISKFDQNNGDYGFSHNRAALVWSTGTFLLIEHLVGFVFGKTLKLDENVLFCQACRRAVSPCASAHNRGRGGGYEG